MSAKKAIIEYLRIRSGGLVNITSDMADDVIALAHGQLVSNTAKAKLYRWNGQSKLYEIMYTVSATDELIKKNIKEALETRPVDLCYMWECYNSEGQHEGKIYTANTNLF